ncbi:SCO7613 C-terminal domain-containing membrane protein [Streptomyces phaeofaciens]|uniref:SCO7613 C-terminal domain-containing membrane protein n=1 Tax=Streptomyces phaeofaciens TaxID=68254 RepID=UPI00368766F7
MTHFPPPAEELRLLDAELRRLDARRGQLLARRAWLVTTLHPVRPSAATAPPPPLPPRPEATAPGVQNVLLLLGGILLTVAAMAFTLVSWGQLGIAGRSLVLGAVTLAVLGAPAVLLRRTLRSTAETVAGLGLALTVLDTFALHEVAFRTADGTTYAAVCATLLAALWTGYGTALDTLRLPLPAALLVAQLPLPLWVVTAGGELYAAAVAVLLTAAFDVVVALRVSGRAVRLVAVVCAFGAGGWGVLAAGVLALDASGPGAAARAAGLFALAAAIAVAAARYGPRPGLALGTAATGGLLLVAGAAGVLRVTVPGDWLVPACLACGLALLAVARGPEPVRRGLTAASAAVQAGAVLWTLPVVGVTLLGPVAWLGRVWTGAPADARAAATPDAFWPPYAVTAPLVLVAVAVVLAVRAGERRRYALPLVWAAAVALPAALELPYAVGLSVHGLAVPVLLAILTRTALAPSVTRTALGSALATSLSVALASLAAEPATLTVLASLTALFAAAALRGCHAPVTAAASLGYATALACAAGASAGWRPEHIALLVLVVPAVAALVAPRITDPRATLAVETTGAVAGLVAVGLAVFDPPLLALVLSLCGVIAAATAVRPDRRAVRYAAAALFVLATWVRFAAWRVGLPEAYTLPVTVPALLVGALRRHRDPAASSWTAYGPGLTVTLLPSLAAAWSDPEWTRPLLLGAAALLLTLLGARHRLRAPLVLGGSALALVTLHELAPYLVQVTDALPRWVPPALAGLLLLALGATYEQRLRDVRRVREVLGRMN